MDEAYIGCIVPWALDWAPTNWAFCNGQLLQIRQNQALWSLLGVTYGGDGTNTFALPDLRGRFIMGAQQGAGVLPGQKGGANQVQLNSTHLPLHVHPVGTTADASGLPTALPIATPDATVTSVKTPAPGYYFAKTNASTATVYAPNGQADTAIQGLTVKTTSALGQTGTSAPLPVLPPFTALNYIICLVGYYPQRP